MIFKQVGKKASFLIECADYFLKFKTIFHFISLGIYLENNSFISSLVNSKSSIKFFLKF